MAKVKQNSDKSNTQIVVSGNFNADLVQRINLDGELINLTDLWREAGSIPSKAPKHWLTQEQTVGFISALSRFLKVTQDYLLKVKRGKSGGTYAHKQIALEYAQYLDQRLGVLVNENYFERVEEEKNPDLIVDRAINTYKRKGKSDEWISTRMISKATRNQFTGVLRSHGVVGEGYKNCTNATYSRLYGGTTAVIREKKHLPSKVNIRDNMPLDELVAVMFTESQAMKTIEKEGLHGNAKCELACTRASKIVADAIMQNSRKLN